MFRAKWGFRGGPARDAENSKTDSRACDFQGGLKTKARGYKGPSEAPRGAQKVRRALIKWVLEAAILKMYGFPQEIHRFSKNARALPGGVLGAFFAKIRGPGGARAPPGVCAPFSGGALGTHSGEPVNSGGVLGGPKGAIFFSGRQFV